MGNFNIVCKVSVKWWVCPLISACKVWTFVSRKDIDVDRLAHFIAHNGLKKKFTTE